MRLFLSSMLSGLAARLMRQASSTTVQAPLAALLLAVLIAPASTQADALRESNPPAYPQRPLTIIVTFPPGGGTDLLARKLAPLLEQALGQSVVVDNRPGASGNIGARAVAQSAPDGHTLLMVNSSFAITPHVLGTPGFDAARDFQAVINVGFIPSLLVTRADSPWHTLAQWLQPLPDAAPHLFASCGTGTPQHLAGAMMQAHQPAVQLQQVPYKGCGPALVDVLGRQVPVGIVTASSAMPYLSSGRLRALAVTAPQRAPQWPDVPTVAEHAMPGYHLNQWHGLLVPAGTDAAIVHRLNHILQQALAQGTLQEELRQLGYTPTSGSDTSPQAFQQLVQDDLARFAEMAPDLTQP